MKNPNKAEGGYARARNMTPERRKEIAAKAAKTRWDKKKAGDEAPALEEENFKPVLPA